MVSSQFKTGSLTVILAAVLVVFSGCFTSEKTPSLLVISVLDKELYEDSHIPGSINVPMDQFNKESAKWPKETKIVLYCSNYMCSTSTVLCKKLTKQGFKNVWEYAAGIAGWYQEKLPVEGPAKAEYLTLENNPPVSHPEGVQVIETQALKEMIENEK